MQMTALTRRMLDVDKKCYWNWQQQRHCCFCEISVYYEVNGEGANRGSTTYVLGDRDEDVVSLLKAAAVKNTQLLLQVVLKLQQH